MKSHYPRYLDVQVDNQFQGLYTCSCHLFDSYQELKDANLQRIVIGAKYKIRCTGQECIAKEIDAENKQFINIFVEPYDCARCNQTEHKSNLILVSEDN